MAGRLGRKKPRYEAAPVSSLSWDCRGYNRYQKRQRISTIPATNRSIGVDLRSFRVFFRRKRYFYDVCIHDTHPSTFERKGGGRWGYFKASGEWPIRVGFVGEIHLVASRVRVDSVSHELDHLRCSFLRRNGIVLNTRNEEWYCKFGDELIRNFYREYRKLENEQI